ncbi:MAG: hypothetical protein B7Z69_01765 [Actinobacteria bacterium 21-73-9]|nr:MAG: hypothetical protein B7Z69_01765 [Actinobacteria bacterium 21-73-9]
MSDADTIRDTAVAQPLIVAASLSPRRSQRAGSVRSSSALGARPTSSHPTMRVSPRRAATAS